MGNTFIATYNPQARWKFEAVGRYPLAGQARFEANSLEAAHAKFVKHASDEFGVALDASDYSIYSPNFGMPPALGFLQKDVA